jgi:hypothetical protein
MPRPSFEREGIEAEIDRVRSLGVDSLRTLWRTTFRSSDNDWPTHVNPQEMEESHQRKNHARPWPGAEPCGRSRPAPRHLASLVAADAFAG